MPRGYSRSPERRRSRSRDRDRRDRRSRSRSPVRRRSRSPRSSRTGGGRADDRRSTTDRYRGGDHMDGRTREDRNRERGGERWEDDSDDHRHVADQKRSRTKEKETTASKVAAIDPDAPPETEEEAAMRQAMGFANFDTTKNKAVSGNDVYVVRLAKKRKYRQYMNRRGGFNRPLDAVG